MQLVIIARQLNEFVNILLCNNMFYLCFLSKSEYFQILS